MKRSIWISALVAALTLLSCASIPPVPGTEGQGTARLKLFSISPAVGDSANLAPLSCEIVEGRDSGLVRVWLPGGVKPVVKAAWSVRGGYLWAQGRLLDNREALDLAGTRRLDAVDRTGRIRSYVLEVRDSPVPTVYLETEGTAPILTKTDWVKGRVTIAGGSTPWSRPLPSSPLKVRGRGNSTWGMPKKPLRFTLDDSASLLGLPKAKKWVLLANYADKSLMRNFLAFRVAPLLAGMKFNPHQQPVLLYLNGEYQGIYGLGEQVETGSGRIEIDKPDDSPATSFFVEVNMKSELEDGIKGKDFFVSPSGLLMEYKTPDSDVITRDQKAAMASFTAAAEKAILEGSGYEKYIDIPSFIDWIILEELFKNQDSNFLSSVNLYRPKGGTFHLGPAWDFDLAAGNSDYGGFADGNAVKEPEGWFALYSSWFDGLCGDGAFRKALVTRWKSLRSELERTLSAGIDEYSALLGGIQADNFRRWPIMGVYVWPNPPELVKADSFASQVVALRTWFAARFAWLDEAMGNLDY